LVNRLLDELTVDPELFISLEAQGEGKYVSAITPDFRESRNRIYLRLRSVEDLDSRIDDIVHASKFGADGQVDIYLKRSLPGIQLDHLTRKPLGVASTPNSYYFSVDCRGFEWQKVLEAGRVSLIWPGAPKDLLVEIIAVKG
jgi:type VI secretion system protein ImpJ